MFQDIVNSEALHVDDVLKHCKNYTGEDAPFRLTGSLLQKLKEKILAIQVSNFCLGTCNLHVQLARIHEQTEQKGRCTHCNKLSPFAELDHVRPGTPK